MRQQTRRDPSDADADVAKNWLRLAAESPHLEAFWQQFLATRDQANPPHVEATLVRSQGGAWEPMTVGSFSLGPLSDLLASAADSEQPQSRWPYAAIPLRVREIPGLMVCLHVSDAPSSLSNVAAAHDKLLAHWTNMAVDLAAAISVVWQRQSVVERLRWLEELLRSVDKWNQARTADERIHLMERSLVQLLSCQHAFLLFAGGTEQRPTFHRRNASSEPELRPATQTQLWQSSVRKGRIYRSGAASAAADLEAVDIHLEGHAPRSLMAIPVLGRRSDVVAALVLVNKRSGEFAAADGDKAGELAQYMSTALHQLPTDLPLGERQNIATDRPIVPPRLIGDSEVIRELRQAVQRVAQTELPVLVMGENGTGKEVVCRMVHLGSRRANGPFLAVNCAALSESLLESELFGHEKGAFTDANRTRAGKFELAHGGTLFLDEIGDMSVSGQVKLLRVLEDKLVTRVGGTESIETDVRVLAATNKDLAQLVRDRQFREDLFFRLNVVTLRLPPLRSRYRDILMLSQFFLEEFSRRVERPTPVLTPEAQRRLIHYQWPGNVRELRNMMERIVFLTTDTTVDDHILSAILPDTPTQSSGTFELPLTEATRQFQIDYITHHIEAARGNMSEAARRLGLHRSNLYRKLGQLGLAEPDSPENDAAD